MSDFEITPQELVRAVEAGEPIQVLDIRAPERLAAGRIDLVAPERFHNVPGSRLAQVGPEAAGLAADQPLAVVCARGISSKQATGWLRGLGFQARSLQGGMAGWAQALVRRELEPPAGFDRFLQLDRIAKGSLGYLLAAGGEALVVDAPLNLEPYVEAAAAAGARIVAVADTHAHADYLSGGRYLAAELGVPYHLHPGDAVAPWDGAPARFATAPLADGDELVVGGRAVTVLHTPGHTAGSVTFVAGDAALTGDFLFVRSIGRPDLGGKAAEWTDLLWQSLERARRDWPPERRVLPAHYSSAAERRGDHSVGATFGEVLASNEPVGIRDRDAFFAWVESKRTPFPEAYRTIKAANLGLVDLDPMQAEELEGGRNQCALG
jgi:glyoxylase-like metal-dependent hydrolase (beta-lactamase superfamily II)